jgi:hypothetical protein
MTLSTRAKLAGLGGALALGLLGGTGYAYAADRPDAAPQYVTTVDDATGTGSTGTGSTGAGRWADWQTAADGTREDCPERPGGTEGTPSPESSPSTPAPSTPGASNPGDA